MNLKKKSLHLKLETYLKRMKIKHIIMKKYSRMLILRLLKKKKLKTFKIKKKNQMIYS